MNFINTKDITKCVISSNKLTRSTSLQQIGIVGLKSVFEVCSDIVDLQINLTNCIGGALSPNNQTYPHFMIMLILTPISGSEREGFI